MWPFVIFSKISSNQTLLKDLQTSSIVSIASQEVRKLENNTIEFLHKLVRAICFLKIEKLGKWREWPILANAGLTLPEISQATSHLREEVFKSVSEWKASVEISMRAVELVDTFSELQRG